jgi:hypothetical protein
MDDYGSDRCQFPKAQASLTTLLRDLLSTEELEQINQQFSHECHWDSQVLWSGIPYQTAQAWAKKRKLQTLTTAMGPLMDKQHSSCLRRTKSTHQWSIYIKGASALFAYHITRQSSKVTVLLPPPPETLNPNGHTNYQLIEEPVLKGVVGGYPIGCVQMAHPTVKGAEAFTYQSWPIDSTEKWTEKFSHSSIARTSWRTVTLNPAIQNIIAIVAIAESGIFYAESVATIPSDADMLAEGIASIKGKQKASGSSDSRLSRVRIN